MTIDANIEVSIATPYYNTDVLSNDMVFLTGSNSQHIVFGTTSNALSIMNLFTSNVKINKPLCIGAVQPYFPLGAQLELSDGGSNNQFMLYNNSNNKTGLYMNTQYNVARIAGYDWTNTRSVNMTLQDSGSNLGIGLGMSNPIGLVHLRNGTNSNNIIFEAGRTSDSLNEGLSSINFNGYTISGTSNVISTDKNRWRIYTDQRSTADYFGIDSYNAITQTSNIYFTLSNSNLGLNKANPISRLHILGSTVVGTGDNTNTSNAPLTLEDNSGTVMRVLHKNTHSTDSTVYNYESGKNIYWGELTDVGMYNFRGRYVLISSNLYVDSNVTFSNTLSNLGDAYFGSNVLINSNLYVNKNQVNSNTLSNLGDAYFGSNVLINSNLYVNKNQVNSNTLSNLGNAYFASNVLVMSNIGIGTITPGYPLDVNGIAYVRSNLYVGTPNAAQNSIFFGGQPGDNSSLGQPYSAIISRNYDPAGGTVVTSDYSEILLIQMNDPGPTSGPDRIRHLAAAHKFQVYNTGYSPVDTNTFYADNTYTTAMYINSIGNVGIGTTTPNAPLQLGNTLVNRKLVLYDTFNNDHQYYGFGVQGAGLRYQVDATTSSHVFYAATSTTTSTELMRITGTGNVGIGTTTPTAKLDVAGTVYCGTAFTNFRLFLPYGSYNSTVLNYQLYGNGTYNLSCSPNSQGSPILGFNWGTNPVAGQIMTGEGSSWVGSNYSGTTPFAYNGANTTTVSGTNTPGEWFQIQMPTNVVITQIYGTNSSGTGNYSISKMTVAGSTNGTTWTLVQNINQVIINSFINISGSTPYSYYRFIATAGNGQTAVFMNYFQILGVNVFGAGGLVHNINGGQSISGNLGITGSMQTIGTMDIRGGLTSLYGGLYVDGGQTVNLGDQNLNNTGANSRVTVSTNGTMRCFVLDQSTTVGNGNITLKGGNSANSLLFMDTTQSYSAINAWNGAKTVAQNLYLNNNGGLVACGGDVNVSGKLRTNPGNAVPYTKQLVLYDADTTQTAATGTNFLGFGIANGQLRYSVSATTDNHVWYQNTTELMRINGTGNVGIGTSAPGVKLDVVGDIRFTYSAARGLTLKNTLTGTTTANEIYFDSTASTGGSLQQAAIGMSGNARNFFIYVNGADRLNIDTTGNVGIGTVAPAAKLDVNGTSIYRDKMYLPSFNGPVINTNYECYIGAGTGDGGSTSTYNLAIKTHCGIGILDNGNNCKIALDARVGNITATTLQVGNGTISGASTYGSINVTGTNGSWAGYSVYNNITLMANSGTTDVWGIYKTSSIAAWLLYYSGGCLGVNTSTPNALYKLDVNGAITTNNNHINAGTGTVFAKKIDFGNNPGGGTGDNAYISYYARSGEGCTLEIGITNDADDHISLMPGGNVGIGTTTPQYKLDVPDSGRINGWTMCNSIFTSPNRGNYGWSALQIVPGTTNISTGGAFWGSGTSIVSFDPYGPNVLGTTLSTNWNISDWSAQSTYYRPLFLCASEIRIPSGNVSIGFPSGTSPAYKLDVNGDINTSTTFRKNGVEIGATGPQGAQGAQGPQGAQGAQGVQGPAGTSGAINPITINPTINTQGLWLGWNIENGSGSSYYMTQKGGGVGGHRFGEAGTNNTFTEYMRLTGTGNVGIGTANPASKLEVYTTGISSYIRISGDTGQQQALELYDSTSRWIMYKPDSTTDLRFYGAGADRVTFQASGNVGIGTTAPAAKLHVVGDVKINGTLQICDINGNCTTMFGRTAPVVTVAEHPNFGGNRFELVLPKGVFTQTFKKTDGGYHWVIGAASSIGIPDTVFVTLKHNNGQIKELDPGSYNLADVGFDDSISEIRVTRNI